MEAGDGRQEHLRRKAWGATGRPTPAAFLPTAPSRNRPDSCCKSHQHPAERCCWPVAPRHTADCSVRARRARACARCTTAAPHSPGHGASAMRLRIIYYNLVALLSRSWLFSGLSRSVERTSSRSRTDAPAAVESAYKSQLRRIPAPQRTAKRCSRLRRWRPIVALLLKCPAEEEAAEPAKAAASDRRTGSSAHSAFAHH